jgi:hypothetical protein
MNTLHYVKHPTLRREELHLKRLAVINDEEDISMGHMEASEPREDGRYALKLVYDPRVAPPPLDNLHTSGQGSAKRAFLAQGWDWLDQRDLQGIRRAGTNDAVAGCHFVLDRTPPAPK